MMHDEKLARAKKRVEDKKGFYTHLSVYLSVGIFFFTMNLVTWEGRFWFFFPLMPWGIGLLIHYFTVFGLPFTKILSSDWEERQLAKELRKIDNEGAGASTNWNDELELKDIVKQKRADDWRNDDLV